MSAALITEVEINEEYRSIAPQLSEGEFKALKASIKDKGLSYAVAAINTRDIYEKLP
jgi:hypothetical protein